MAEENGIFPAVDIEKELNPGNSKELEVDSVSSKVAAEVKERKTTENNNKKKKKKKKDTIDTIKTTIIISGIVVVVASALIAMTRKLREK